MGRGTWKESICEESALTQTAYELRGNWPQKKKSQHKENSEERSTFFLLLNDYFQERIRIKEGQAEGGAGEKEAERRQRKAGEGNAGGWAVAPGPHHLSARERSEGK